MANSGTHFVLDQNTVVLLPAEISSLLAGIPQYKAESNNISISNLSSDSATIATSEPIGRTETTYCVEQPANLVYSNQILTPISPNILTPENSPVVSTTCNSTPKGARSKFLTQFDESPLTPVSSRQASKIVNTDAKPNFPATNLCNQSPVVSNDVKPFGTLVFFDLETTGLGHMIGKSNVQITEISMVAVDRKEFWVSKNSELKEIRIMHKLSMCVRPRSAVSPGAAKITGLDNFNLIDQYPFDRNAATTIISFLSHLPKPVGLLAHNGNTFDFPLLKSEFKRLSMELPSDLLVADTLVAFRTIGIVECPPDRKVCKSVKYGRNGRLSHSLENLHLFFFNKKPANGHSSEGDCLALAKVCHKLKENALPWLEANAKTLDTIIPMW
ncbi:three prime repair exonuclease 2 [Parasteatoda tepidariorum]|uniref:three prime repair exonuclease 2 n=1 Tax=Parasteatoda tepidariorum TaxID=114398 RepID=UPI00077F9264|nr:three-prime repair exonuclease 1 [Parasteatoda tepidariorum]